MRIGLGNGTSRENIMQWPAEQTTSLPTSEHDTAVIRGSKSCLNIFLKRLVKFVKSAALAKYMVAKIRKQDAIDFLSAYYTIRGSGYRHQGIQNVNWYILDIISIQY